MQSRKADELTEADLEWFKLERYRSKSMVELDLAGWASLVLTRLMILDHLIAAETQNDEWAGQRAQKDFKRLQENPVAFPYGFDIAAADVNAHPTDTTSVRLARVREIRDAARTAKGRSGEDIYSISANGPDDEWELGNVLVNVDLSAPREQIVKDFRRLLKSVDASLASRSPEKRDIVRERFDSDTRARWVNRNYVSYFDLTLFEAIENKRISPKLMIELLHLGWSPNDDFLRILKVPQEGMKIFTWETFAALAAQATAEQSRSKRATRSAKL